MLIVKRMADFGCSNPMSGEIKYLFHYPPRVLIGYELALDFGMPFVAYRSAWTIIRSVQKTCTHSRLDLFAGLPGVHFVENVEERCDLAFAFLAVHSIADCDISYPFGREVDVCVLSGENVVPAKP